MSATNALPLEFVKSSTDESKTIFETVMKWKMDQKKADTLKWDEEYQKWRDSPDAKAIKEHLIRELKGGRSHPFVCLSRQNNVQHMALNAAAPSAEILVRFTKAEGIILGDLAVSATYGSGYSFTLADTAK